MIRFGTVAIVGVGLLGGSIGAAVRQRSLAASVVGVCRSEASRQRAEACGLVDRCTTNLPEALAAADLIVICTPVGSILDGYRQAVQHGRPDAVATDAGSSKTRIVRGADLIQEASLAAPRFVGSHPLAGDHRSGPEAARADLLEGRTVVVTPTEATDPAALTAVVGLWEALGAKVERLSPEDHDATLAQSSHLPHLLASVLAATTPEQCLAWTAGGWRDSTRIAAGDPELWADILLSNPQPVIDAANRFEESLSLAVDAIDAGDRETLVRILQQGSARRNAVGN
ncbi:prephenate dehydrogenase [Pirellulimonas nuda]|uniref:Prephenate dehydrogenase n=1 Tax=Pirellulimonas nuda TaxID=2528009 RepID=A0A518DBC5_9BACT|nr:prephenate dehydrogenase/arogenate dehydrogenase family protein [Pirellulimonas nuda]QDU88784.1 prephenate dehydrogenase [Pirellulimonas nuda]